jgi:hypothetical protein
MDAWAARSPNLLLADSQYRGYLRLALARDRLQADLIAMDSVKKAGAGARTLRSFVIETNRPGPIAM